MADKILLPQTLAGFSKHLQEQPRPEGAWMGLCTRSDQAEPSLHVAMDP